MLTGDNQLTADAVASDAGILAVHAELLPGEKVEVIQGLQSKGPAGCHDWRWYQ